MSRIIILFYLLVSIAICTKAQILEGKVMEKDGREPVAFAFIGMANGIQGTVSNEDGHYKIDLSSLKETDTIVVSHISYLTRRIRVADLQKLNGEILLTEGQTQLKEVVVNATEDDAILLATQRQSKKDLNFPVTAKLYYREWVKDNNSYSRFSDGILMVNYPLDKEDMKIKVEQSRAYHLPKNEDEIFDINSPLKVESILRYAYVDFPNHFLGDRKKDYHFYEYRGTSSNDYFTIMIEPKSGLKGEDDKLYYDAVVKANKDKDVREVSIALDSLTNYERSVLGLKMNVLDANISLTFRQVNNQNLLYYARVSFTLNFTYRKQQQRGLYVGEFILLDVKPGLSEISRKDSFSKTALYKNGTHYQSEFWKDLQMPLISEEGKKLLADLEEKLKAKGN